MSGTRSAPLASSHGSAEDAVDEIEDAHGALCKQSLDLTDVLDTVHIASPFCVDTIFYHICGGKIVELCGSGEKGIECKKSRCFTAPAFLVLGFRIFLLLACFSRHLDYR